MGKKRKKEINLSEETTVRETIDLGSYYEGLGDYQSALSYFRKAAEQNSSYAELRIGVILENFDREKKF